MRTTVFLLALWLFVGCGAEQDDRIAASAGGSPRGDITQLPAETPHVFGIGGVRVFGDDEDGDYALPPFEDIPPLVPPGYDSCDYVSSECSGGCLVDYWSCSHSPGGADHLETTIACCSHIGGGCKGYCVGFAEVGPSDQ